MSVWHEMEEASDENIPGLCMLDFYAVYGVPASWSTPSADNDQQEEPEDITP